MKQSFQWQNKEAVSAVIGVILMVAVAIAMAAAAYAYFTGMIGNQPQVTPTFSFTQNIDTNTLVVAEMEKQSNWEDLMIKEYQGTTEIIIQDQTGPKMGPISTGEATLINGHGLSGTVEVLIVYIPTSTMVFQGTFSEVTP